ncbi:MAG: prolyl oligopeptidase family serine peptidase [Bacteroidota bacterium]
MNRVAVITILILFHSILFGQENQNHFIKEVIEVDTFFSAFIIKDKYRWLEDVNSAETKAWVATQYKLSRKFLSSAQASTNAFNIIDKYGYSEYHRPLKLGDYYFTSAFYNNQNNPALFYQFQLNGRWEILIDPSDISTKDEIDLNDYAISKNSKLLAYQFSRNGSDWKEVKVVSMPQGFDQKDHLKGLKFSNLAWLGNGFFYSTFSQDGQFGVTQGQRVFFHNIGTEQSADVLIFERKKNPTASFDFMTTSDERFFVLKEENDQTGIMNIFYIDYKSDQPFLRPLITNLKEDIEILDSHEGKFIAITSLKSNNGSIVEIDPENPYKWRAIAAEFSAALLLEAFPFNDRIVAIYQADQHPIITVLDYSGTILFNKELPVATSLGGFSGRSSDDELLYFYTSYTIPPIVYKFNIRTFKSELTDQTGVNFDFTNIEYKEVEYFSTDSVRVSMVLVYANGMVRNGDNPAILKAYGGYGIVSPPSFDPGIVYFIKNGGIFAFANIRGGGEKGIKWAKAGRGKNKQNTFDDFIAAAEYLIENKYTSKDKLAATGASHGGLVVAAAAIQRPDLFKAVVPIVAPLDMLRKEKFTVGKMNNEEYGSVEDSVSFKKLLDYSPYHNIREDVNYPAMLIITSENDDRVPPFHSYKFVARLQNREAQKNPIILKIQKKSGHHGASTLVSVIKEDADIYGFIMNELLK